MNSNKVWAQISDAAEDDYFALNDTEKAIYHIRIILDAVNGNGLLSYYESDYADFAEDAVESLYAEGMEEVAAIIENANAIFPGGCPPEDAESRIEIIDSWDHEYDSLFDQWNDDILEFALPMEETYDKLINSYEE